MTIVAIISMAIFLMLLANTLFLRSFYARQNKALFYREYEDLKKNFIQPDNEILELLREMDRKTGFLFFIAEVDGFKVKKIVLTSIPNFDPASRFLPKPEDLHGIGLPVEQLDFIMSNQELLQQGKAAFGQVQRQKRAKGEFDLFFAAPLDSRYLLIIVRPVEQLDEHRAISNQFMLIIGLITLLISIIIARMSAKSIVKPIKEITEIGEHIADLDFSHRYTGCARDEIGLLGESINRISTQLDTAIRNLQTEMMLQKRFFAGVSHEFKTPVGLIRGYAESIKLGLANKPEEIVEFSEIILDETDRLNHLITDIMFLVKSESAEFVLNMKVLEIISLVNNSLEKNLPAILEKGILLEKDFPPELILEGDEIRIRQIFENLLSNAIRHTPRGGKLIINATVDSEGITFWVKNEGEPIPKEHLEHLFDPFYSAYESRDKASTGTGLGLSIVKNLVEKHGGRCGIENIRDERFQGVRAWFLLPNKQ